MQSLPRALPARVRFPRDARDARRGGDVPEVAAVLGAIGGRRVGSTGRPGRGFGFSSERTGTGTGDVSTGAGILFVPRQAREGTRPRLRREVDEQWIARVRGQPATIALRRVRRRRVTASAPMERGVFIIVFETFAAFCAKEVARPPAVSEREYRSIVPAAQELSAPASSVEQGCGGTP